MFKKSYNVVINNGEYVYTFNGKTRKQIEEIRRDLIGSICWNGNKVWQASIEEL